MIEFEKWSKTEDGLKERGSDYAEGEAAWRAALEWVKHIVVHESDGPSNPKGLIQCIEEELKPHGTPPAKPQHGREPDKVKPLAQYLAEYLDHDMVQRKTIYVWSDIKKMKAIVEQALDAYQSTENVTIKIERV